MTAELARETAQLTIAGQELELAWYGPPPGDQPVIIFLHEGLGCVDLWRDFPLRIAEQTGYPVMSYSRAGYGRSSPCALPRPVRYMHAEGLEVLPALIEALQISDYILFGHSDGASIAIIYAGGLPAPGLRGLLLEAPHLFTEDICVSSIAAARQAYADTDLRSKLQKYHGGNVDCAFFGWADAWLHPDFLHWNLEEYLSAITAPVLAIQGRDDEYGTLAQLDSIAAGLKSPFRRLVLDNCGHSPHRDQADQVIKAASDFILAL